MNVIPFNAANSKYYKRLLNSVSMPDSGNLTILNDNNVNTMRVSMKCSNCSQNFSLMNYQQHCCQYDDNGKYIFDKITIDNIWMKSNLRQLYVNNTIILEKMFHIDNGADNLQQLYDRESNELNYTCSICKRMYVHVSGLRKHMEIHSNNIKHANTKKEIVKYQCIFKCSDCGTLFGNTKKMFDHRIIKHPSMVQSAFDIVTLDKVFQCEFCDFLFDDEINLLEHESKHDSSVGFECTNCLISSPILKDILQHRDGECPYEVYSIGTQIYLAKFFVCHECNENFESVEKLFQHRYESMHLIALFNQTHHRNEYLCEKCGQNFPHSSDLAEHASNQHIVFVPEISSSKGNRPFLCDICGKGYTQSSHLYQHLRFHKGIKPFACTSAGCNRRFTIRPDLNDHIRKCHTGERPYKCNVCNKTFLTGSVYYQHRLIHRGERRYGCSTCNKRFHRSDALKNHERIHTGDRPYACGACPKAFRQKGDRDKHFRSRHSILTVLKSETNANFVEHFSRIRPICETINGIDILTMVTE